MGAPKFKKNEEVRVKKVKPYPIEVSIGSAEGQIAKLIPTGFLAYVKVHLRVGDQCKGRFKVPVQNYWIEYHGLVVKTYDQFGGQLGKVEDNMMMVEVSFSSLSHNGQDLISHFNQMIGQE